MNYWRQLRNKGVFRTKSPDWKKQRVNKKALRKRAKSEDFYTSEAWYSVRYQALKRSNGCCECCGTRASKRMPLHADHIKPRSRYPALALTLANIQILCKPCNLGKSNTDTTDWRLVKGSLTALQS